MRRVSSNWVRLWPILALAGLAGAEPLADGFLSEVGFTSRCVSRGEPLGPAGIATHATYRRRFKNDVLLQVHGFNYTRLAEGAGSAESSYDAAVIYDGWRLGSITAGYVYYDRNNNPASSAFRGHDTQEVYAGIDFRGAWSPWLYTFYDFDAGAGRFSEEVGWYTSLGASRSWSLGDSGAWLDCGAKVGLDFGRGIDGYRDALLRAGVRYPLSDGLSFGPVVEFWFPSSQVDSAANGFRPVLTFAFSYSKAL